MATLRSPSIETMAFIDLLDGYANDSLSNSKVQNDLKSKLKALDPDKRLTRKIVSDFKRRISKTSRRKIINGTEVRSYRWGRFRSLNDKDLKGLMSPKAVFHLSDDDVGEVIVENFPADTKFTLKYKGLYCKEESRDRNNPWGSDEPYIITSAVSIINGENIVRTELHPIGVPSKSYGDVDENEIRNGPIAACWHGELNEVSMVVTVMEHDEGDPDYYKKEIEYLVKSAAYLALLLGYPIPDAVQQLAVSLINFLVGSDDDNMGVDTIIFTPYDLRYYATRTGGNSVGSGKILPFDYHRNSYHDEGAKYYVFFSVEADKAPLDGPVIGPVERVTRVFDTTRILV